MLNCIVLRSVENYPVWKYVSIVWFVIYHCWNRLSTICACFFHSKNHNKMWFLIMAQIGSNMLYILMCKYYEHIYIFAIDFLKVTFYYQHYNVRTLLHIRSTLKQTNLEKVCLTPTPKEDRLTSFNWFYS